MRSLQFTPAELAAHEARIAKYLAEGRIRKVIDGHNDKSPAPPEPKARLPRPPSPKIDGSRLERAMVLQLSTADLPVAVREYMPFEDRKFRLDFAWPDRKLGLECDGVVHRTKERFYSDIEKHALLLVAGWRVLRVGRREISDGWAMAWLKQLLEVV